MAATHKSVQPTNHVHRTTCAPPIRWELEQDLSSHTWQADPQALNKEMFFLSLCVQLIVVLLPSKDVDLYREVKRTGDSELGITSQCLVAPVSNPIAMCGRHVQPWQACLPWMSIASRRSWLVSRLPRLWAGAAPDATVKMAFATPTLRLGIRVEAWFSFKFLFKYAYLTAGSEYLPCSRWRVSCGACLQRASLIVWVRASQAVRWSDSTADAMRMHAY